MPGPWDVSELTFAGLDRKIDQLHKEGKRTEVVALMRQFGIFTDESVVADYLAGKDK